MPFFNEILGVPGGEPYLREVTETAIVIFFFTRTKSV
jgi:hypothetical protein